MRLILLIAFAQVSFFQPASAQVCLPEAASQPDSGYAYMRTETKALQWVRLALAESQKIQPLPPSSDPERMHKAVALYTVVDSVSTDYDCAVRMLSKYKNSKNESVRASVDALLEAINTTKTINKDMVGMMEALDKATKPEDIDQIAIAKMLANVKGMQKDAQQLTMMGAKMSTFGIVRTTGEGDDAKPVAFTITAAQREALLADVKELIANKGQGQYTYVDGSAEILLDALTRQMPLSAK
jgi:hypothetical protein